MFSIQSIELFCLWTIEKRIAELHDERNVNTKDGKAWGMLTNSSTRRF